MALCNAESLEELYKQTLEKMSEWQRAYDEGHPVMSDREWDDHYWSLINLEKRLGYADPNSPTQKIEYKVINKSGLAFDHDEIIVKGIMDLRYKVNSTDIVFNLMPEEFTIGELKQVYSLLLGKELVNSAFRRVIAPKIVETGKMTSTGGHRPSMLCKYNEGDH